MGAPPIRTIQEFLWELRKLLAEFEPLFAETLSDTLLAAWLQGAQRAASNLPEPIPFAAAEPPLAGFPTSGVIVPPPPDLPKGLPGMAGEPEPLVRFPIIEAAANNLADRRIMVREDFDRLIEGARRAAFTVARVSNLDAIEKIQMALAEDVRTGGTLAEFEKRVEDALGGSALHPSHIENVYRTNVGTAAAEGLQRTLEHPLVAEAFPYLQYHAVHDSRARAEHRQMEKLGIGGTNIYRRDDPIWQLFFPPWDYQCRCAVVPLSIADAARLGIQEAKQWHQTGLAPEKPIWVPMPSFRPSAGFVGPGKGLVAA